jgi:hypothetical protein
MASGVIEIDQDQTASVLYQQEEQRLDYRSKWCTQNSSFNHVSTHSSEKLTAGKSPHANARSCQVLPDACPEPQTNQGTAYRSEQASD